MPSLNESLALAERGSLNRQGAFSEAGAATKLAEQGAVHIHTWELVEKPEDQWKNYGFYLRKYIICAYIYIERYRYRWI